jgi:hypothetical protein
MYIIEDWLQDNIKMDIDITSIELLNNIFLCILVYIFYSNVEFTIFIKFIKYYILLLCIRYLGSLITTIKDEKNKRYFQINGHVGLFLIITLLCIETNTFGLNDNKYLALALIILYSLIVILTKYGYTYDIIITILLIHYIFNLEILKDFMS